MRDVPARIFSRADALATGWSDSALRRATAAGRIVRLRDGTYAPAHLAADPRSAIVGAAMRCDRAVVSHASAARLHGLPLIEARDGAPHLTVPPGTSTNIARAQVHRAPLPSEHVVVLGTTRVTSPARTLVDLARTTSLDEAVAAIDFALHRHLVDAAALQHVIAACRRWPGMAGARRALRESDRRSESPLESISRLALVRLGIPAADLQRTLLDRRGRFLGRADFYWDDEGVVGEADGRSKYTDRGVLFDEKLRQERMEEAGLVVVRWTWHDVRRRPDALAARIRRALARGRDRTVHRNWAVWPPPTGESG